MLWEAILISPVFEKVRKELTDLKTNNRASIYGKVGGR